MEWDERYQQVKDLLLHGVWDEKVIQTLFQEKIIHHILNKIHPPG